MEDVLGPRLMRGVSAANHRRLPEGPAPFHFSPRLEKFMPSSEKGFGALSDTRNPAWREWGPADHQLPERNHPLRPKRFPETPASAPEVGA
jgi:hypothetical protein